MKNTFLPVMILLALTSALLFAADKAADKAADHKHAAPAGPIVRSPSPEGAKCYIISPKDGATVEKTFTVRFGLKGMGVAPAGVDIPNTGHHHLLIDIEQPDDMGVPLPTPDIKPGSLHFGGGQTETEITLTPGKHTLRLVLGDKLHVPHDPPVMSKLITVTVE